MSSLEGLGRTLARSSAPPTAGPAADAERLDGVARALVGPVGRRGVIKGLVGVAALAAAPGLLRRPAPARAATRSRARSSVIVRAAASPPCDAGHDSCQPQPPDGDTYCCTSTETRQCCAPGLVKPVCCTPGEEVCCGPGSWANNPSSPAKAMWCCPSGQTCGSFVGQCTGCERGWTRCGGDCCPPGVPCRDGVCETDCPPERLCEVCCQPGEYCDKKTQRCCPPGRKDTCLVPEPECKKKVDEFIDRYIRKTCSRYGDSTSSGSHGDMRESAWFALSCHATAELVHRRGNRTGYGSCKQIPSDAVCGGGAKCDPASGLCKRPDCSDMRFAGAAAAIAALLAEPSAPEPSAPARASASQAARLIRRRLRRHRKRLAARQRKVLALARRPPSREVRPDLARELTAYRRDVLQLRREVAAIPARDRAGRRAQKLVLAVLDDSVAGLRAFAQGVESPDDALARRRGKTARRRFMRAGRRTRRVRSALGCGKRC